LLLLVSTGLPSTAAAQLGKLKKALGDKAKESACVPDRPPTIIQTVTLSAAQMAAINAGLDAEIEAAPALYAQADKDQEAAEERMKEYNKAHEAYQKEGEAYEKARQKHEKCAEKVQADESAEHEKLSQKSEAAGQKLQTEIDTAGMQDLAARAGAAAERVSQGKGTPEDHATMAQFQQMMAGVSASGAQVAAATQEVSSHNRQSQARLEKACGPTPVAPEPPELPASAELPGAKMRKAGAKGAKMSDQEYHVGRETLLALAMSNSVVKGSGGGGGEEAKQNEQIKAAAQTICRMNKAKVPLF
jgi:hypothetical protein